MKQKTTSSKLPNYTQHKLRLLETKYLLLNQMQALKSEFNLVDKSKGDESDQSVAHQEEHNFLVTQDRYKFQLMEIESALARIENGTYGICEETLEPIEDLRLRAIPWTRFSIEGAEIRQQTQKNAERKNIFRTL